MKLCRRSLLCLPTAFLLNDLGGCTNPSTQYFRLSMVPGGTNGDVKRAISIKSVRLPGYLNQNGIAKADGDYEFGTFGNDLWADPLADMLQAVMAQDLAQRLPASVVTPSDGAIGSPADIYVEIDILRFDPDASGQIVFTAQLAIKMVSSDVNWRMQTLRNNILPASNDAAGTAAAMSAIWASAADQTVALIIKNGHA